METNKNEDTGLHQSQNGPTGISLYGKSILHLENKAAQTIAQAQPQNKEKQSNNGDSGRFDGVGDPAKGFWDWKHATEPYKKDAMKMACRVSNCNMDFLRKITAENGSLAHNSQSTVPRTGEGSLNGREDSWGYCQMYRPDQGEWLNNPKFWNDPEWQMAECFEKWRTGTPMYAEPRPLSEFTWVSY